MPLLGMIGNNHIFAISAVNQCSPCCYQKQHNPKKFVSTLTIELERQLTLKVDEVGLLLRHLYGYNSVCFVKSATPLRIPGRLNLGLIVALKTHAVLHKPKKEAFHSKNVRQDLLPTLSKASLTR